MDFWCEFCLQESTMRDGLFPNIEIPDYLFDGGVRSRVFTFLVCGLFVSYCFFLGEILNPDLSPSSTVASSSWIVSEAPAPSIVGWAEVRNSYQRQRLQAAGHHLLGAKQFLDALNVQFKPVVIVVMNSVDRDAQFSPTDLKSSSAMQSRRVFRTDEARIELAIEDLEDRRAVARALFLSFLQQRHQTSDSAAPLGQNENGTRLQPTWSRLALEVYADLLTEIHLGPSDRALLVNESKKIEPWLHWVWSERYAQANELYPKSWSGSDLAENVKNAPTVWGFRGLYARAFHSAMSSKSSQEKLRLLGSLLRANQDYTQLDVLASKQLKPRSFSLIEMRALLRQFSEEFLRRVVDPDLRAGLKSQLEQAMVFESQLNVPVDIVRRVQLQPSESGDAFLKTAQLFGVKTGAVQVADGALKTVLIPGMTTIENMDLNLVPKYAVWESCTAPLLSELSPLDKKTTLLYIQNCARNESFNFNWLLRTRAEFFAIQYPNLPFAFVNSDSLQFARAKLGSQLPDRFLQQLMTIGPEALPVLFGEAKYFPEMNLFKVQGAIQAVSLFRPQKK